MGLLNKNCKICQKIFEYYDNMQKHATYCSIECRNRDYKGKHFSEKTEFKKGQIFIDERNLKTGGDYSV